MVKVVGEPRRRKRPTGWLGRLEVAGEWVIGLGVGVVMLLAVTLVITLVVRCLLKLWGWA